MTAGYRRRVTEAAMREAIMELVARRGGRCFFVHDSRRAPAMADWPDLAVILPDRGLVLFLELKSAKRDLTVGQCVVLDMLRACQRVETLVVRPVPRDATETGYDELLAWLAHGDDASGVMVYDENGCQGGRQGQAVHHGSR